MYKSPIQLVTDDINYALRAKVDDDIYRAVLKYDVSVDKDELIKALTYDREQYDKGYSDGYMKGTTETLEKVKTALGKYLNNEILIGEP